LFALSLAGLARSFARLASAGAGRTERRIAEAMRRHPQLVGGTGRDVTRLMAGVPGLVAKDGAEGVQAAALPDGRAVAVKIEDGAGRARAPVIVAALERLGVDTTGVADLRSVAVLGHGEPVGQLVATLSS
jgi:L-asparaginase II